MHSARAASLPSDLELRFLSRIKMIYELQFGALTLPALREYSVDRVASIT